MIISKSPRNRLSQYFLRRWFHYDKNVNSLCELERTNMKILYSSIKTLTEYEIEFLAEKYRVDSPHVIKDSILSVQRDMSLKDYKAERIRIEDKLQKEVVKNRAIYKPEGSDKQWS